MCVCVCVCVCVHARMFFFFLRLSAALAIFVPDFFFECSLNELDGAGFRDVVSFSARIMNPNIFLLTEMLFPSLFRPSRKKRSIKKHTRVRRTLTRSHARTHTYANRKNARTKATPAGPIKCAFVCPVCDSGAEIHKHIHLYVERSARHIALPNTQSSHKARKCACVRVCVCVCVLAFISFTCSSARACACACACACTHVCVCVAFISFTCTSVCVCALACVC